MKKSLLLSLWILGFTVNAQFHSEYFVDRRIEDSTAINLNVFANGFFHNNEFFSTDEEGYTLIGNQLLPSLGVRLSKDLRMNAGAWMLKYHGQSGISEVRPFFNLSCNSLVNLEILLGSYLAADNHQLPEPLMARELNYTDPIMEGILIRYNLNYLSVRTWLDWEQFIEPRDPFREIFNFGFQGEFRVPVNETAKWVFPLYMLANHKGGQIDTSPLGVETIADLSTGFRYQRKIGEQLFDEMEIEGLAFMELDTDDNEQGYAFLGQGEFRGDFFSLSGGFFHGRRWESIMGNPLMFSGNLSSVNKVSLILLKAGIGKNLGSGSSFSARFEAYFDPDVSKMQYVYGLYIVVNEGFLGNRH